MKPSLWSLKKSPWVYHVALSPCNNCDIEILDVLTPKFDVERFGIKLVGSIKKLLVQGKDKLHAGFEKIIKIEPHRLLREKIVDLSDLKNRENGAIKAIINKGQMLLIAQKNRLAGLNPKSVLQRGYSITTNKKTGLLVRKPEDVEIGDAIITELAKENLIESKITKK